MALTNLTVAEEALSLSLQFAQNWRNFLFKAWKVMREPTRQSKRIWRTVLSSCDPALIQDSRLKKFSKARRENGS
jgi:hypothetical protein